MVGLKQRRQVALEMAVAAIAAANPASAVRRAIKPTKHMLQIGPWSRGWWEIERVFVVGAGKAAATMCQAAETALGDDLTGGVAITKRGHSLPLERIRLHEAGHPIPDEDSAAATRDLLLSVADLGANDIVIVLISGGGSALMAAPAEGISLADKQDVNARLIGCGATINEVNCVRKHLSAVKGGRLAEACAPADVISLILSDVIDDPLDVIASGPTSPDPTTFSDAVAVLAKYSLTDAVPEAVTRRLRAGAAGKIAETPKPGARAFDRVTNHLVGTNAVALSAAASVASSAGYEARVMTSSLRGEAREVARVISSLVEGIPAGSRPVALVFGGEPTVTLGDSPGRGGRNQELALAAAIELEGRDDVVIMSIGTDGTDGPTDAAGAIVDGQTCARAAERGGTAPREALALHDAYPLLEATGDLVKTGPTGTNVMDVVVALIG